MSFGDICALPVAELAAESCLLFLWTTAPCLEQAFEVIRAWGFEYKSNVVWDKEIMGMGHWVRVQHEHLLIANKTASFAAMSFTGKAQISSNSIVG